MTAPEAKPQLDEEDLRQVRQIFEWTRTGHGQAIASCLQQGLPANLRNEKGDSLLMLAAYHGHVEVARALLDAGADPELQNDRGQTPLAAAVFKGDEPMCRLLIERGARVDGRMADGKTAFIMAAMFGRTALMDLLVEHGADPAARDAVGWDGEALARKMAAGPALEWFAARRPSHVLAGLTRNPGGGG